LESKERVSKINFDFLVWSDYPAIRERWLMAADNSEINFRVLFEFLKLVQIPPRLFLDLFFGKGGEIGINQD
jgi:hypothetical protein